MSSGKFLLLSDVHANFEALKTVLKDAEQFKYDEIIVLGDTVDYNSQPNECLELLKKKNAVILLGNHDAAAIDELDSSWFGELPQKTLVWTKKELNEKSRLIIRHMPKFFGTELLLCVHATPRAPLREYMNEDAAKDAFEKCSEQLIVCGHVHKCFSINEKLEKKDFTGSAVIDFKDKRLVFSMPSVGQPRDGNPHTGYAVLDLKKFELTVKRLPYDVKKTADLNLKKGLPKELSDGLYKGLFK